MIEIKYKDNTLVKLYSGQAINLPFANKRLTGDLDIIVSGGSEDGQETSVTVDNKSILIEAAKVTELSDGTLSIS